MSPTKSLLKTSRLLHLYLGVFATPALIFFAITGFLQTFSFHETTRGSDYKPPKILVQLGQLHKKQTLVVPVRKPQPPVPGEKTADNRPASDAPGPEKQDGPPTGRHNGKHQSEGHAENPAESKDKPATEKPTSDKAAEPAPPPYHPHTPPILTKTLLPTKISAAPS
ncbi:hypothetical protein, partial [Granulicella sp. dw_53]|uniref:hypothetical protein n=1 Tax=Granulicella sp. dw_53 TaxID=2719792 RepID=UPI001BD293E8